MLASFATVTSALVLSLALLSGASNAFVLSPASLAPWGTAASKVWTSSPQRSVPQGIMKPLLVSSAEATALAQVADEENARAEDEAEPDEWAAVGEAESSSGDAAKAPRQRIRHTLFVGNLDFGTTDVDLRSLFEPYGSVELINLPRDRATGRPRGFAFVDMATEEAAAEAVAALDGTEVRSRAVRVTKSVPKEDLPPRPPRNQAAKAAAPVNEVPEGAKKIYVGNIPFETTAEEVSEHYQQFGEVLEAYIPTDRSTGSGRGFAFVTMKEEDADKAIEATNGSEFQGRKIVVSLPLPPGEKAPTRRNQVKLYIGNLSFYTIADTLVDAFSEFGTVIDCYLPEDPNTGAARGFGFVTMDSEDAERAVRELDGCEIDGRVVRVNIAQPKGTSSPRRGRDSEY